MAETEAQRRAKKKYHDKTYEQINILAKKGTKEKIKAMAEEEGKSISRFILDKIGIED